MINLENCPHCGGEVMLCRLNTMISVAEFSIVCTKCGLETRIYANPMANCCFDMGEAVKTIVEKWNRRDGEGGPVENGSNYCPKCGADMREVNSGPADKPI